MLNNISFIRNPREDPTAGRNDRAKPQAPRDDRFRKTMDERRPTKDEQETASAAEEKEEPPSLFDLSKTNKSKGKSNVSSKSTFKENSSETTQLPVTAKQSQEFGEDSSQDSSQLMGNDDNQFISDKNPEEFYGANEGMTEDSTQQDQANLQSLTQSKMKKSIEQNASQSDTLKQAQVASTIRSSHKIKEGKEEKFSVETDKSGSTSKKSKSSKSEESNSKSETREFAEAVNSSIQSTDFQTEKAPENQEVIRSATIRELATQIIDRIQTMRRGDEMQTMITLRNPPVLEGSTITLTASDHAKREFNISFANLTPEAKILLDRKLREDPLTDTLERKGIIVHMLNTTTQTEPSLIVDAGQATRDQQDQQQQQQQQRRQKFQLSEEEENA